jgi:hypothetical protein
MRKNITAFVALGVLGSAVSVLAQGNLNYSIRVTGSVVGHVYNVDPAAPGVQRNGNTAAEVPPGSTTYAGALLQGTGFSAQLFAANNIGQSESALTAVPGSIVSFRTGATLGGTIATLTLSVPQVPGDPAGSGTFQLRAWDNLNGTLTTWAAAEAAWTQGLTAAGKSQLFDVAGLNLPPNIAPNMLGFRSFNLTIVPEPSTFVLAGLGAAALVIFRRRK